MSTRKRQPLPRLHNRLPLAEFFIARLGFQNMRKLRDALQSQRGDDDGSGHSGFYNAIRGPAAAAIDPETLDRYDRQIMRDVRRIGAAWGMPITLTYAQYLAVLFSEHYLDRHTADHPALLRDLNEHLRIFNARQPSSAPPVATYSVADLYKLAFWMATGAGKTLIMHLNMLQALRYGLLDPRGQMLLITPNEGLTEQHMEELRRSGLPCMRLGETPPPHVAGVMPPVRVVEIHKLAEQRSRNGVSIPLAALGEHNIVFVDEGHKGNRSEQQVWKERRERIGRAGFLFEYSATFAQAVNSAGDQSLLDEYGRAIALDYSYRYFYEDGYGKEFDILNIDESEFTQLGAEGLLMGNLLAFYEQRYTYDQHQDEIRPYKIEPPLAIFVGASVNAVEAVRGEKTRKQSDVLRVVQFLARTLANDQDWAERMIERILRGDLSRLNAFRERFHTLRHDGRSIRAIYSDLLKRVFDAPAPQPLRLLDLKRAPGEIGLQAGDNSQPFGVIYIGDAPAFLDLANTAGLCVAPDRFTTSLFLNVNRPGSPISMVIGAKKFNEGWNSYRVSCMGLLNVGRSEGSTIIQLFGRGVRLRGLRNELRRSSALEGAHPPALATLETLNIFSLRADYLNDFKNTLRDDGIPIPEMLTVPTQLTLLIDEPDFARAELLLPRLKNGTNFLGQAAVALEADPHLSVTLDLRLRARRLTGTSETRDDAPGIAIRIPDTLLDLLDWEALRESVRQYALEQNMTNIHFEIGTLRRLFTESCCLIDGDEGLVDPTRMRRMEDLRRAQRIVATLVRDYLNKFYRRKRQTWEHQQIEYQPLRLFEEHGVREANLIEEYRVTVRNTALIEEIHAWIAAGEHLKTSSQFEPLSTVYLGNHLYQPLIVKDDTRYSVSPPGLDANEQRFIGQLDAHLRALAPASLLVGAEIYVLRNQSKTGVGFFESSGFYPDFIIWIKRSGRQWIVFVDPKGLRNVGGFRSEKVRLAERLKEIERELGRDDIILDAFLIANTSRAETYRMFGVSDRLRYDQAHILFQSDVHYIEEMFAIALR